MWAQIKVSSRNVVDFAGTEEDLCKELIDLTLKPPSRGTEAAMSRQIYQTSTQFPALGSVSRLLEGVTVDICKHGLSLLSLSCQRHDLNWPCLAFRPFKP